MKSLLFIIIFSISLNSYADTVPEKVLNVFNQLYPKATEVKWTESDAYYTVRFTTKSFIADFDFDKDGKIIKSVRYYDGSQLNPFLIVRLKKMFPDYQVMNVTESIDDFSAHYIISLSTGNSLYIVQSDGNFYITVEDKFRHKGSQ